jgi:hypothetical protein
VRILLVEAFSVAEEALACGHSGAARCKQFPRETLSRQLPPDERRVGEITPRFPQGDFGFLFGSDSAGYAFSRQAGGK